MNTPTEHNERRWREALRENVTSERASHQLQFSRLVFVLGPFNQINQITNARPRVRRPWCHQLPAPALPILKF